MAIGQTVSPPGFFRNHVTDLMCLLNGKETGPLKGARYYFFRSVLNCLVSSGTISNKSPTRP